MTKQRELTQDNFDQLLAWLDADRARAAQKYEDIRLDLIRILTWNGCYEAEDLADEAINRVTAKVPEIAPGYEGDPKIYFYGVAKRLLKEWRRRQAQGLPAQAESAAPPPELPEEAAGVERLHECMERCLGRLAPEDRRLILGYYQENKQAKIDLRRRLAEDLRIGLNALRVKVYRIRAALHQCIARCLGPGGGEID